MKTSSLAKITRATSRYKEKMEDEKHTKEGNGKRKNKEENDGVTQLHQDPGQS